MSASASSGAEAGRGDFVITAGGGQSSNYTLIVIGLVAVVIVFLLFRRK